MNIVYLPDDTPIRMMVLLVAYEQTRYQRQGPVVLLLPLFTVRDREMLAKVYHELLDQGALEPTPAWALTPKGQALCVDEGVDVLCELLRDQSDG